MSRLGKGGVLRKIGEHQAAVASFDAALELDPEGKLGAVWNNKGQALLALQEHAQALESLAEASRIDPQSEKFQRDLEDATQKAASMTKEVGCGDSARPGQALANTQDVVRAYLATSGAGALVSTQEEELCHSHQAKSKGSHDQSGVNGVDSAEPSYLSKMRSSPARVVTIKGLDASMNNWSILETQQMLTDADFRDYAPAFKHAGIKGQDLHGLTDLQLKGLGMRRRVDRERFRIEVERLQRRDASRHEAAFIASVSASEAAFMMPGEESKADGPKHIEDLQQWPLALEIPERQQEGASGLYAEAEPTAQVLSAEQWVDAGDALTAKALEAAHTAAQMAVMNLGGTPFSTDDSAAPAPSTFVQLTMSQAFEAYSRALDADDDNGGALVARLKRGLAYRMMKSFQLALSDFQAVLEALGDGPEKANAWMKASAWSGKGLVFADLGKLAESMVCLANAMSLDPSNATLRQDYISVSQLWLQKAAKYDSVCIIGSSLQAVNGFYEQRPEEGLRNGQALFQKVEDEGIWLRFSATGCWMISDTFHKEANDSVGFACCVDLGLTDPSKGQRWKVFMVHLNEWVQEPLVTMRHSAASSAAAHPIWSSPSPPLPREASKAGSHEKAGGV